MKWSLHQLFPICPKPTCPYYKTRHMLPIQQEVTSQILTGEETYIYWQGGVGASKTMTWGCLAAAYMIMVPESKIILCRKDFALLYATLWLYFKEAIKAANEQGIIKGKFEKYWIGKSKKATSYCELPNGSIARSVQLKAWSEGMGPSYDAIFISDAMENQNFGEVFKGDGVVGGLQSRLRGAPSTYFQLPDGTFKDMRRFLIESNTPPNINEIQKIFGREAGVRTLPGIETSYRHIQTPNILNDHLPPSYIAEIAAMHPDPGDRKRILEGKSVPYYGGVRVIKHFSPELHVLPLEPDLTLPLLVGIDQGKQHPGVVFCQEKLCDYGKSHFIALSEISNLYDKTSHELVELETGELLGILGHLKLFYPTFFNYNAYMAERERLLALSGGDRADLYELDTFFDRIQFAIDRSANKVPPENKDRESTRIILAREFGIRCRYINKLGLDQSLDRVDNAFNELCVCNLPKLLVNKDCEMLIDGYSGGYRYSKKADGSHSLKPIEDHQYEDIADAHRYCLENFFLSAELSIVDSTSSQGYTSQGEDWRWMYTPESFSLTQQEKELLASIGMPSEKLGIDYP